MGPSMRERLDCVNWGGRAHLNCGQCQPMDWGAGLKERREGVPGYLCFLIENAT